jgi:carboxyl-terminal processing protease
MQEKQRGSFYGLGIIISKRNGKITVMTPVEGSPAERLGIRAGDIIDMVEGQRIDDLPVDAVVKKLKGPKGTQVHITIIRPGLGEPLQMTVTRAEIPTNSVSFTFMLEPGIGYIRLKDFTHTSVPEVEEAWDKLAKEGMTKLVFDRASRRLVGCHCIGERASELVHVGQAVMTLGGTVETLIEMVFNYPTLSETYKYAAYDALGRLGPK